MSEVAVCSALSRLVNVTREPAFTVRVTGAYLKEAMLTLPALAAGGAAAVGGGAGGGGGVAAGHAERGPPPPPPPHPARAERARTVAIAVRARMAMPGVSRRGS